ncbi:MAG: hypothetical protein LBK60_08415 [Verrucomicrobiales bacterium]|jgi:hypothetical protein|nr:hypothetical protein [Verrucomicrobiales bacterium]
MSMQFLRWLIVAWVAAGGCREAFAGGEAATEVWSLDTMYRFSEAYQRALAAPLEDRAAQYAKAVTILNLPTKTQSNINDAANILTALVTADADDEVGVCAQYFLGRIAQAHNLDGANFPKARELFRKLYRAHPGHSLAQLGYVQWVLMELYDKQSADPLAARLRRLEAEQPALADREVWKNYHLVMGQAYMTGDVSKPRALEHYLLADQVGMIRWRGRSDFYAVIASLARETGRREVAVEYCRKFLRDYPRDQRSHIIRQFLNELQPNGTPP